MFELMQFGFGGDQWWSWIVWIGFMMVFFLFYPRIMLSQIMWKLEKTVRDLEMLSEDAKDFIANEVEKNPPKTLKNSINRFFEFFIITPVSLDPYGMVKKMEHVIVGQRERFKYFVNQIAPKASDVKKANIGMGLAGGITLYELTKVVRHYVETVKKTKSFQIAMIIQMQLPLIEHMAKAVFKGTKALARGEAIGDAAGPYVVAKLIGDAKTHDIEDEVVVARKKIYGKDCFLVKAKGPGGSVGRPGKAVERIVKSQKIDKIISIDAAAKLEGEKTGSVAEGVGVAMGGPGVERSYIENIAVTKNIPLDSIIIKMSGEEAIMPMRKSIKDAFPVVKESIQRSIESVKGRKIIIVGVGNTSGVGNSEKDLHKMEDIVERNERKLKAGQKKKK